MNSSNEILNELATLSPLLAGMERTNVFSVPDGYFNTLAETIVDSMKEPSATSFDTLSKTNLSETPEGYFENLADIILNKAKQQAVSTEQEAADPSPSFNGTDKNVFEVPNGYFESLSDSILNRIKLQSVSADAELNNLSAILYGVKGKNVFEVPHNYFEGLSDSIFDRIRLQSLTADAELNDLSPTLYGIKDKNVFEVPDNYFEGLSDTILNSIKQTVSAADEIKELSPMLYSLKDKNVFKVPAGYFNTIEAAVLTKVKPQPAKVVAMHKRSSFFKYASAAMIACIAVLGVYKFVNKTGNHNNAAVAVASLDPSIQNGLKMNAKQFDQGLNSLSDDEIASYLDKNGNYADVPALSSSIDENSLPDADQYLIDDKTLDNYLNDNDLEDSKK